MNLGELRTLIEHLPDEALVMMETEPRDDLAPDEVEVTKATAAVDHGGSSALILRLP